uniref:DUF2382 domain-containing protein n=1 Tax=Globodera pallida TaxID=36090 RepID=A0A183CNF6_GLOPA
EHRPRTLVDADGRRANVVEYQPEVDSLQFFEEQERQIVQQLARETLVNEHHQQVEDGVEQRPVLDEDGDELMSRIEEAEENEEENGEEVKGQKEEEEEAEENEEEKGEEVEGQKEEEEEAEDNEEEKGEEVEGQKKEEEEEEESANFRHSNDVMHETQNFPVLESHIRYPSVSVTFQNPISGYPSADIRII